MRVDHRIWLGLAGSAALAAGLFAWQRVAPRDDLGPAESAARFSSAAESSAVVPLEADAVRGHVASIRERSGESSPAAADVEGAVFRFIDRRFVSRDAAGYRAWRSGLFGRMAAHADVRQIDAERAIRYVYGEDAASQQRDDAAIFDLLFGVVADPEARTPALRGFAAEPAAMVIAASGEAVLPDAGFWYGYISAGGANFWRPGCPPGQGAPAVVGLTSVWSDGSRIPMILRLRRTGDTGGSGAAGRWEVVDLMLNNFPEGFDVPPLVY